VILSDEQLESIAQTLAHERGLATIDPRPNGNRKISFYGTDIWHQWELNKPAFIEVMERTLELWGE
jgi:hypothetical protein